MNEIAFGSTTTLDAANEYRLQDDDQTFDAPGLRPIAAFLIAIWYSFTAAAAMSYGFAYLHPGSEGRYSLIQDVLWAAGIGIGIGFAVFLAKRGQLIIGVAATLVLSGLLLVMLLLLGPGDRASGTSIFGHSLPSLSS